MGLGSLLWPVLGHLVLVQVLFAMVSLRRFQAVRRGEARYGQMARAGGEPELSRRWARNLDNQFQVPLLFYALVALLYATGQVAPGRPDLVQTGLAWVFLAGRIAHTVVQVSRDDVKLRGRVFAINYLALSAMWLLFFARQIGLS
ncbi:MAG: MAPEG family protein [Pseudomonadota bacterium]